MADTLTQRPPVEEPPKALSATFGYYTGFIGLGLSMAVLGATLDQLAYMSGTKLAGISYLFMAKGLGYLVGTVRAGGLYDKYRGHLIMGGALGLMALGLAIVPMMSVLLMLAALMFIVGFGEGLVDVGGNALIVWAHPKRVDPWMNALHFFYGIGAVMSPLIIVLIAKYSDSVALIYWVIAVVLLIPAVWINRLPSPKGRVSTEENHRPAERPVLLFLLAALFFLCVGAEFSLMGWIKVYAEHTGLASVESAPYFLAGFLGAFTVGRLLGIPLSAWISPSKLLAIDIAGALICVSLVIAFPQSVAILWIGTIGMGASIASMFATAFNYAERRMAITGRVTSWFLIGASLGSMTVPWLIGQLFERMGPEITMKIVAIDLVIAALLFMVITRYCRRHNLPA